MDQRDMVIIRAPPSPSLESMVRWRWKDGMRGGEEREGEKERSLCFNLRKKKRGNASEKFELSGSCEMKPGGGPSPTCCCTLVL